MKVIAVVGIGYVGLPLANAVIVALARKASLSKLHPAYVDKVRHGGYFIDVKSQFDAKALSEAELKVWRL